jgi:hypothetical protein
VPAATPLKRFEPEQGMPKARDGSLRVLAATVKPGPRLRSIPNRFPVTVYVLGGNLHWRWRTRAVTVKAGQAMVEPPQVKWRATRSRTLLIVRVASQGVGRLILRKSRLDPPGARSARRFLGMLEKLHLSLPLQCFLARPVGPAKLARAILRVQNVSLRRLFDHDCLHDAFHRRFFSFGTILRQRACSSEVGLGAERFFPVGCLVLMFAYMRIGKTSFV